MDRLTYNRYIVAMVAELIERHPDWRFHQILQNASVSIPGEDQFYEESEETFRRSNAVFVPSGETFAPGGAK